MRPWDWPLAATAVHMLVAEALPVWAFWISFLDVLISVSAWLELWFYSRSDRQLAPDVKNVGELVTCVRDGFWDAAFTLDVHYSNPCVDGEDNMVLLGWVNLVCFVICVAIISLDSAAVVFRREFDCCSGAYVRCKWELRKSGTLRCAGVMLLLFSSATFVVLLFLTVEGTMEYLNWKLVGPLVTSLLMYQTFPIVTLFVSAYSLMQVPETRFDISQEGFDDIRFRRTWAKIFFQSNASLMEDFGNAVTLASLGRTAALEALVLTPSAAEVLRLCEFGDWSQSEETDGGSGSEQSGGGAAEAVKLF
mmetsp:Transcript_69578/g.213324  ORF Transcript_69578/g.213324 Transcript_69578/m.213324 type:complete len:306 (-) Transcript_69578:2-919(-)